MEHYFKIFFNSCENLTTIINALNVAFDGQLDLSFIKTKNVLMELYKNDEYQKDSDDLLFYKYIMEVEENADVDLSSDEFLKEFQKTLATLRQYSSEYEIVSDDDNKFCKDLQS